ncbi:lipopolysaccharide heptosyltransferase II [Chthoniobacter flavus Ellin428]|uniref:lipopolysaccharide heptosyltransferase II n=1 Tax=Chthoniobacter flavus Ellin428 TaxID=497964 RepID=B4D3G7_9BACT|nr:lipopolysaccharide heptosyltransferase II [Chthoniobacter flavus]EDY18797.1 lipopolysaccharide heptosyltransferase II [Chthoniobacter flavus Ellin428]TCO93394.1 lipopolysaccharide heptosyltransferase II [Chthoniobacter flavus]
MDRLVFAIYRLASAAICLLPLTGIFRLGWLLGSLAYYVASSYRQLVLRNLLIAFHEEKSRAEIRALARRHFATLGANLLCSIKIPRLPREEIRSLVTIEGLEEMKADGIDGAGFVFVISHLGSWELFAQLTPIIFECKVGTIFQALGNPYIDAEVRRDRARLGLELFERKEGIVHASQFIRAGGGVGILIDQHAGDAGLWCPFFNRLASTTTLPAMLALRTSGWLVPAAVYTDGVARWRCVISKGLRAEGQSVEAATVSINRLLEQQIRRQPEDWFWVHNRWKTPKPKFLLQGYKRGVALAPGTTAKDLQPFRILIRGSNWLGDAIMSVPAVRAIKRGRIDAHVTILTPAKLADVWKSVEEVDEVLTIERDDSIRSVAKRLRWTYDVAILFPNSLRVALEVWLAEIPRRVGYPGHQRRSLLNQVFAPKKKKKDLKRPEHQVHHYLALAEFVGADIKGALKNLPANPPVKRERPVIGLCPGAEYGPAKRWLPERFAQVVRIVQECTGAEWKIFGVEKDRPIVDTILTAAKVPCTDLVGKTTLEELMAQLQTCDLLLTNDTGTMHLASFLGVPTVSIFGSTEPTLTGPLGVQHRVLRHHVACSPCFLRECPIDFRCMTAIGVTEVVEAVLTALPD